MTHSTASTWLDDAERKIREQPESITRFFPAVGRQVGRDPLDPASDPQGLLGSVDDAARTRLVGALIEVTAPERAGTILTDLYRHGDDAERRGVLRGLAGVAEPALVAVGIELVRDALRTNDPRIVAAALGEFSGQHLPAKDFRGGVLKALFMQIPLRAVANLAARTDAELITAAQGLEAERRAAGREINDDLASLSSATPS